MFKRKKISRIIAFLCGVFMCISAMPISAMAETALVRENSTSPAEVTEGILIPQFMIVPEVSSEESEADLCYGRNALDGDTSTMWHTKWSNGISSAPHWIILDLGKNYNVCTLYYLPRQDGNGNGMISNYTISVSTDGTNFEKVAGGSWKKDTSEKKASFSAVSARYIRLEGNDTYASCSEINIETTDLEQNELWAALSDAEITLERAIVGTEVFEYPQEAYDTFANAVAEAKTTAAMPDLTVEQGQKAAQNLLEAKEMFLQQQKKYERADLEKIVLEGRKLAEDTQIGEGEGQAAQAAKDEFLSALQAAESILNKENAEPQELHQGYLKLSGAMGTFRDRIITSVKSLAGLWGLKLGTFDPSEEGMEDTCVLPGTLDENRKGNVNTKVSTNKLNRKYTYTGSAVYQKKIFIPQNWEGKSVTLFLERTKMTRVWMNGTEQTAENANSAMGVPQIYQIENFVPGEENVLTVQVTNSGYPVGTGSHMLTDETVTNWNGIIGKIELTAKEKVSLDEVRIYPDIHKKQADIKISIKNKGQETGTAEIRVSAESYNHEGTPHRIEEQVFSTVLSGNEKQEIEQVLQMGEDVKLWSEFDPAMYRVSISLAFNGKTDSRTENFGMREFSYRDRKFTINGTKTFLRGEGNSAVFPLTGYPYMTKEEWMTFFGKAEELGINFFRFHSWAPPEAAFEAADELGIYMQPELYGFGGTPYKDSGSAEYFKEEAVRILHALANHPSFVMMSCGNELNTDSADKREIVNEWTNRCREEDDTRLYAEGTNNNYWKPSFNENDDYWTTCKTHSTAQKDQIRISFSWADDAGGGTIESLDPNTDHTYDNALQGYTKPIMNHEAGQYQVLPKFDEEIPKYDRGIFEARNLKTYRNLMESKGLLYMNDIFSKVSARVSAIGYRADIETALRSNDLAGYQLLSIQDFPGQGTAHVGILDNFMEEKEGGFTKAEYKNFNQETVVLGKLPQLIFTNDEMVQADAIVVNYSPDSIESTDIYWKLKKGDVVLEEGTLPAKTAVQGQVTTIGKITAPLSKLTEASHLTLEIGSNRINNCNAYDIWVYPKNISEEVPQGVTVAKGFDENAKQTLEKGGKVLLLPSPNAKMLPKSVEVRWTTDYWSKMFHKSDTNAHTMGMYVQNTHPVFKDFPTDYFNDYQWFHLMKGSRALILDELPQGLEPLAWNIDHMQWGRKLGSLFEANVGAGKLMVCTFNLSEQMEKYPEARQLYRSILNYMESAEFLPKTEVTAEELATIIGTDSVDAYKRIEAENYSQSSKKFGTESGKEEGNTEKQTAVGGIVKNAYLKYDKIYFGGNGADKLVINGANNNSYPEYINIYDDDKNELIKRVEFVNTQKGWGTYCSQEFDIPRQTGVKTIRFEFEVGSIAFNYFQFKESEQAFMDPYKQLDPESVTADIQITDGEGGSHAILQNYVSEITDEVQIQFNCVNFGDLGSGRMILSGRALSEADVTGKILYLDENGQQQEVPFTFRAGEGEAYELSSETFFRQRMPLIGIKGEQNLIISFDKGTRFDFEALSFVEMKEIPQSYKEALEKAESVFALLDIKPLYYTKESADNLRSSYDRAKEADILDEADIKIVTDDLNKALKNLVETQKSKSAYTVTYARNYDKATGNGVVLERQEDQVVGDFDKGEQLLFEGLDFGERGAMKLTIRAANGRKEQEEEHTAKLKVWYGTGENDYIPVEISMTGGWTADYDKEFSTEIAEGMLKGVKEIQIELSEGAVAFHSFVFEELPIQQEADKDELHAMIERAYGLEEADYTPVSWAEMRTKLTEAEAMMDKGDATQEEVNKAMEALESALKNLVKKSEDAEEKPDPKPNPKPDPKPDSNAVTAVEFVNKTDVKLNIKKTETRTAVVSPANANTQKVTYTSSHPKVAAVDPNTGTVRAKSPGKTTIMAVCQGYKDSYQVLVKPAKVKKFSVRSRAKKTVTVKWKRVKGANGYQIQITDRAKKLNKAKTIKVAKGKTVKKVLKKLSNGKRLKRGKKVYVRIRAYTKAGSTIIYGDYSAKKWCKVK